MIAQREDDLPETDLAILRAGMRAHAEQHVPWQTYEELSFTLRNESGALQGAALGETGRGWLKVELIWIAEELRGQGYGSQLLSDLEAEAVKLDCAQSYLDTFSYQARPFYESHGYEVIGELEDYPIGHSRYFMRKRLSA